MNRKEKRAVREMCGAKRKMNARRIRAYLLLNEHTPASVAEQKGISRQAVYSVINGLKHTPDVLDALLVAGVPAEYLEDPRQVAGYAK